jgi:hypothetical protein
VLRNGTATRVRVCACCAACRAIIVHRCNLKRIARGLVGPEVPNDLGLHTPCGSDERRGQTGGRTVVGMAKPGAIDDNEY